MSPRSRRFLTLALVVLSIGALAGWGYYEAMKRAWIRYNEYDIRTEGSLSVGDLAPDIELASVDGSGSRTISELHRERPLVLIFGSYTWPPFRARLAEVEKIREDFEDRFNFAIVYIKEAHPDDEWQMDSNLDSSVVFEQPKTFETRLELAKTFVDKMEVGTETYVDDIRNTALACYAAWPERIYVIATDGRILYKGGIGPFYFDPNDLRKFLEGN